MSHPQMVRTSIVSEALNRISDIRVSGYFDRFSIVQRLELSDYRVTGMSSDLNFQQVKLYGRSCWSRSIKSASLFKSCDLSKPVTFLPQVVLKATRAAFTAASMSFSDAEGHGAVSPRLSSNTRINKPATTLQISSSVAGLITLCGIGGVGTHR